MLRVPIEQAKPGMPLALPVNHPGNLDRVLLHAGAQLTDRAINRLRGQGVYEIWIAWPGLEFICEYVSPQLDHAHREFTHKLANVFDAVADDVTAEADYASLKHSISNFLNKLLENPRSADFLSELMGSGSPLLRHSSAVCLASLMIGLKLAGYLVRQRRRLPPRDAANIVNLGVGAMLHDIGMLHIPREAVARFNETSDERDASFRAHVEIGHRMVMGRIDATAAASVLHHHQRFDGTGFPETPRDELIFGPKGLRGESIHIFPRIIAATDLFDRLRYGASDRPIRPRVRALNLLRSSAFIGRLDPMVVEGLLAVTPPYPVGSVVTLTSGDNAVVTRWAAKRPCRPEVRLIGALDQSPTDMTVGRTIDLDKHRDLAIAYAEDEHVLYDNFSINGSFRVSGRTSANAA